MKLTTRLSVHKRTHTAVRQLATGDRCLPERALARRGKRFPNGDDAQALRAKARAVRSEKAGSLSKAPRRTVDARTDAVLRKE